MPLFEKERTGFNHPCKCCRKECISVGSGYCATHYQEMLTEVILGRYPVSGKELIDKMNRKNNGSE